MYVCGAYPVVAVLATRVLQPGIVALLPLTRLGGGLHPSDHPHQFTHHFTKKKGHQWHICLEGGMGVGDRAHLGLPLALAEALPGVGLAALRRGALRLGHDALHRTAVTVRLHHLRPMSHPETGGQVRKGEKAESARGSGYSFNQVHHATSGKRDDPPQSGTGECVCLELGGVCVW